MKPATVTWNMQINSYCDVMECAETAYDAMISNRDDMAAKMKVEMPGAPVISVDMTTGEAECMHDKVELDLSNLPDPIFNGDQHVEIHRFHLEDLMKAVSHLQQSVRGNGLMSKETVDLIRELLGTYDSMTATSTASLMTEEEKTFMAVL